MTRMPSAGLRLAALLLVLTPPPAPAQDAGLPYRTTADEIRLATPRWALALDAKTGALRRIEDRAAAGPLLRGGADLWTIERHDAPPVRATAGTFRHRWDPQSHRLTLDFDGPDAAVTLACDVLDEGPAWQAEVRMKRGTMLGWRFPESLAFDVAGLDQFVLPEHLGLAFLRPFFEPGGSGVGRHPLGPEGLLRVANERRQMRPVRDEPVPVRPGAAARDWLPEWYQKEMPRWRVVANRGPGAPDPDRISIVETEHGPWLWADRLGGRGWLVQLGGRLDGDDRPRVASVIATLAHLHGQAGTGPKAPQRIGLVLGRPTGRPGGRVEPDPSVLLRELSRQDWLKRAGLEIVTLRDASEVRAALSAPGAWFALVNLIPEGFPAESAERADAMLDAIQGYVRNGGVWWEAGGGYAFYHAVVPQRDVTFRTANRDFCDVAALASKHGRWTLYGVQAPDAIFVPSAGEVGSSGPDGARVGRYTHTFRAYATAGGDALRLPLQQMVLGQPHREVLRDYARRNGFTRGLDQKASKVAERLKRSLLLKVSAGSLATQAEIARKLPFPVLFHTADYLHGGFDKQYPDHLPPNPRAGTPEDLARLIAACRERGHLFMPYTNPTWWCTNPKGPTFERVGDAPLSRDLNGNVYPESYGLSTVQGYTTCAWHPAVRAANDVIRRQFTEEYPVDVLLQDQVGARDLRWDTNPAAPGPGAYLEGIHRIARVDSAFVPVATEDGHDRLINWETIFCGLSFPWLPNGPDHDRILYEDLWPAGSWRIEPLALFLAHDRVLFTHHDLGGFVRDRRDVSVTLAMGYNLSWWTRTPDPSPAERDWLDRLGRLQAAVGPRCAGRPLDDFAYLAPGVIRSRWGDLTITANLTAQPYALDADTAIAPDGFLARSPDLEAGIVARHRGRGIDDPAGTWFIADDPVGRGPAWTAGPERAP